MRSSIVLVLHKKGIEDIYMPNSNKAVLHNLGSEQSVTVKHGKGHNIFIQSYEQFKIGKDEQGDSISELSANGEFVPASQGLYL
jgi:hypothetical protein